MKVLRWILFAIALALLCVEVEAGQKLTIATEGAYRPFNYIDEKGELAGFDVDIAHALCEAMTTECDIVAVKWDDIFDGLAKGNYDAIIASVAKTPERQKIADFTGYYYRSRSAFAGESNINISLDPNTIKGLTFVAQQDTVQAAYLNDTFKETATIRLTKTTKDAFDLLVKGEADLILSDSLTIFDFLQTEVGKSYDFIGKPLPAKDPSSEAFIAVSKGTGLVDDFNAALKKIRLNGTYDRINRRYFPFSIY